MLIGSFHWLRKVRNSCAHNERIYSIHRDNGRILNCYFDLLPKSYRRERTQKVIDLLLYLKFYLDKEDYKLMIIEMKTLILDLESRLSPTAFRKVRADLGIKDLAHLDLLLTNE